MKTNFHSLAGALLAGLLLLSPVVEAATTHTRPVITPVPLAGSTEVPAAKHQGSKVVVRTASRRLPARKVLVVKVPAETVANDYCWGQVLGPDHRPLPGACVFVAGQPGAIAATNSEGKFRLRLSAPGTQMLTIAYAGLRDQQVPVVNTLAKKLVVVSLQR